MNQKTPDALRQHWTDRLPAVWKPYAQLSRLDRPIGWQLLLLPCLMGLALARTGQGFFAIDAVYTLACLFGAIAMRGAGCTYNDIVDQDIDAQVARTRARPIPSGAVSVKRAWAWLLIQCLVGLAALLTLPNFAKLIAIASLPLVALYPFMKRVTWWPQAWLGIVFSWGALVASAAESPFYDLPLSAYALYAGCIAWTIAYDTIYALQDREDDALIGVRSTARLFGKRWRLWTLAFYVLALFFWGLATRFAEALWPTTAAIAVVGVLMVWPNLRSVNEADGQTALAAFKYNAWVGLAMVVAFALEPTWRTIRALRGG
ncbi:MAG TPA: 4-hydroxybenzoate octaprenyltransferase [Caulobacterales bacterium]|nr:4-hydroxybenzoate octaprenyltransferase [Caulobacterales bacterium]